MNCSMYTIKMTEQEYRTIKNAISGYYFEEKRIFSEMQKSGQYDQELLEAHYLEMRNSYDLWQRLELFYPDEC